MTMAMMITSTAANHVPASSSVSTDMRSNSCRYNNGSDNSNYINRQISGNNAVSSGYRTNLSDYVQRLQNNGTSTNTYHEQPNYQHHNHDHVECPRNQDRIIKHVGKIEISCDNVNSLSTLSGNSFYRPTNLDRQCEDKDFVMKLVSPHRDSSKLAVAATSITYPHYEEHLITRYNQHQISSPSAPYNNLHPPQVRRNCGGHASSPEPSTSPPAGADRSSSTGSCVSSFSEPLVGVGSRNSRKLTSYHRKKKVLDVEDDDVNIRNFTHR
jgi:hypothetical protein